jgi:hypothetical protein
LFKKKRKGKTMILTKIFYHIDNFCNENEKKIRRKLLQSGMSQRVRQGKLSLSEVLTIIIYFPHSGYKNFKTYYEKCVCETLKGAFRDELSYSRFLEIRKKSIFLLAWFIQENLLKGPLKGFIDSTALPVCHNKRINSHKVFKGIAKRGKTSMGWFYGFKLHVAIDLHGNIAGLTVTPGNVHDANPKAVKAVTKNLSGTIAGDKGYISKKLFDELFKQDLKLITRTKKGMKPQLITMPDKMLLNARKLIESVFNVMKNYLGISHSRHRSIFGFMFNLLGSTAAYIFYPKKPSLKDKNLYLAGNA